MIETLEGLSTLDPNKPNTSYMGHPNAPTQSRVLSYQACHRKCSKITEEKMRAIMTRVELAEEININGYIRVKDGSKEICWFFYKSCR